MSFLAALLLVLAHSQDFYPVAAVASVLLFTAVCAGRYPMLSVFRSVDVVLAIVLAVFSIATAWIQCGDLIRANPIGYFASDGRATYMFFFYLAMRLSLASRPEAVDELLASGIWVAAAIALFSAVTMLTRPMIVGDQSVGTMLTAGGRVAVGLLGTKNSFAGNNTAALVIAFALWLMRPRLHVMPRSMLLICLICLLAGSILSGSRGYLLGGLASCGLVLLCYRTAGHPSKRQIASGLILGVGCIAVLSATFVAANAERMEQLGRGSDANVVRRFQLFGYAASIWSKSMLVGVGPGSIMQPDLSLRESYSPWYAERLGGAKPEDGDWMWVGDLPIGQHAHNQGLQLLADYGLIGLGLVVAVIAAGIRGGVFRASQWMDERELVLRRLSITSLVFVTVAGASAGYTLASASIAWSTWALVAACRSEDEWYTDEAGAAYVSLDEDMDERDFDDEFDGGEQ
ncbi:MAG: O-antigen ligase family protein [Planctomycetota bacterium]